MTKVNNFGINTSNLSPNSIILHSRISKFLAPIILDGIDGREATEPVAHGISVARPD